VGRGSNIGGECTVGGDGRTPDDSKDIVQGGENRPKNWSPAGHPESCAGGHPCFCAYAHQAALRKHKRTRYAKIYRHFAYRHHVPPKLHMRPSHATALLREPILGAKDQQRLYASHCLLGAAGCLHLCCAPLIVRLALQVASTYVALLSLSA